MIVGWTGPPVPFEMNHDRLRGLKPSKYQQVGYEIWASEAPFGSMRQWIFGARALRISRRTAISQILRCDSAIACASYSDTEFDQL